MKKPPKPRFCIVTALVLMIPSFLLFLKLYGILCENDYISFVNGEMFVALINYGIAFPLFFLLGLSILGAILLLTTVYALDKAREEEQEKKANESF